jgi:hypothetical protein
MDVDAAVSKPEHSMNQEIHSRVEGDVIGHAERR